MTDNELIKLQAGLNFADQLKQFQDTKQHVAVVLSSGTVYTGLVAQVESGQVVLTRLVGKEFFDAKIAIGGIIALETRAKNG